MGFRIATLQGYPSLFLSLSVRPCMMRLPDGSVGNISDVTTGADGGQRVERQTFRKRERE